MLRAVSDVLEGRADYYDVRVLHTTSTSLELRKGEVTQAISGKETGGCVRVLYQGAWGFASAPEYSEAAIGEAADKAARLARGVGEAAREKARLAPVAPVADDVTVPMKRSFIDVPIDGKLQLLRATHDAVKGYDFVANDLATYKDTYTVMEFFSSEGATLISRTPRVLWSLELVGRRDGQAQSVRRRIGATAGLEAFDGDQHLKRANEAVASLVALLSGKAPPAGAMTVIADPGLSGVFAHEAVGHAAEGDLVATGDSCLEGQIGKQVGSSLVTIRDDATVPGLFGSLVYDDEGVRAGNKVLIKDGVLQDYILSRETAAQLGLEPNGGARAESYHGRPLVRMSNTLFEPGDMSFEELLEGVEYGVYAKGTRGGQVNTAQGVFQFNAQEAYLIEHGEIIRPLRDVSLSGHTLETLQLIDGLARDESLDGVGICGKGQSVPVGQGGPHVRIAKCVVGGR